MHPGCKGMGRRTALEPVLLDEGLAPVFVDFNEVPFQPTITYCGYGRTLTFYQALPSRERAESKITSFVVGTATQLLFSLPEERGCKNLPKIRSDFGDSVVSVGAGKS